MASSYATGICVAPFNATWQRPVKPMALSELDYTWPLNLAVIALRCFPVDHYLELRVALLLNHHHKQYRSVSAFHNAIASINYG